MRLAELTKDMIQLDHQLRDCEITGLTADSRSVEPGYLFAALPSATRGSGTDGRNFIADAVARGAVAVLAPVDTRLDAPLAEKLDSRVILDGNPRRRLALMAARFFALQPRTVVAVTGTNGKSSVAGFARQIWNLMGARAAALGTLGVDIDGTPQGPGLTTPDPVALHRTLAELARGGVDRLAMEASSHGLDQFRLDGVRVSAAAFTNLTRDHLDYHGDEESYFQAKMRLFRSLLPDGGTAVLNADSDWYPRVAAICRAAGHHVRSFGERSDDMTIADVTPLADGLRLCLSVGGRTMETRLGLIGAFQAHNVLAAYGLVVATGADPVDAFATLARLRGVHGRMERAGRHPGGGQVFIDYAHTPDALATVLKAIRPHVGARLHVVFGAGGDRDPGKRPLMGEAAANYADRVIVTDDNPRREDAATIRRQILAACPGAQEIADRAEAIETAIAALGPDDILVIAGKGHETGQIVGGEILPFDDGDIARTVIANLGGEVAS